MLISVHPIFPITQRELSIERMTLLLLWQECELHPNDGYSYSHFCQRYRDWLGTQFAKAQIFVAVLGASGYTFAQ